MTADVVRISARSAPKGLTSEIEKTLKRWDAAGVDWVGDPEGVVFTADHKTEVVMNFGPKANIRVLEHSQCPGCPVPCAVCGARRKAIEMRDIIMYAVGDRRDTLAALVCTECVTTGPLAPVFAAMERQAKAGEGDCPW